MNLWDGKDQIADQKNSLEAIKNKLNSMFSTNDQNENSMFEQPDYLKTSMFGTENSDPFAGFGNIVGSEKRSKQLAAKKALEQGNLH